MDADGANPRPLLADAVNDGWSNDSQFVLAEWRPPGAPFQLVTVRPDGTDQQTLMTFEGGCPDSCAKDLGWGQPQALTAYSDLMCHARRTLSSIGLDPLDTIALLESQFAASEINWEAILAVQYRTALRTPRTIVDVGAHIGQHVDQFVQMGTARIVAFEPVPRLAADLLNKFGSDGRLEVHEVALFSKPGRSEFHIDHDRPGESGMRARSDRPVTREVDVMEVDVMTLDQFAMTDVDYIKVDVEGAEVDVLSGAESTIRMWRPLISVEHGWQSYRGYGRDKRSLLDWANIHEYVVCDLFGSVLSGATYDECVDRYYWDYLLVPADNLRLRNRLQLSGRAILDSISKYVQPTET